jgi:hypothetical protein
MKEWMEQMPHNRDSQGHTEELPTHDEIQNRAYHLYLKNGEEFSPMEYWLIANEELKKDQLTVDVTPPEDRTLVAAGGHTPRNHRLRIIAEIVKASGARI